MRFNKHLHISCLYLLLICCNISCNNSGTQEKEAAATTDSTVTAPTNRTQTKNIVFFGNSLTAAYGLDVSEGFPANIQRKLDSLNLPYKCINAGLSGETTAGGVGRIDWILQQPLHIFVLELGGNDGLRGIPLTETSKNLQTIIDKVKDKYPDATIVLAGMRIPPNLGKKYSEDFHQLYKTIADKNKVALIPFLLEGVGGEEGLNLPDGIHPNAAGQKLVAENVWKVLQPLL